jgi:chemotaxis protein CheD
VNAAAPTAPREHADKNGGRLVVTDDRPVMDVFLQPGDMYFGDSETRIRTLLGSCVAMTLWHPLRRIGGMSHCLLPGTGRNVPAGQLDGRYVDEAIAWLMREAIRQGTRPTEYQIKLFGGGDMFASSAALSHSSIGQKNAIQALSVLGKLGLSVLTQDLGGSVSRSLIFDVASGDVWVRRGLVDEPATPVMAFSS